MAQSIPRIISCSYAAIRKVCKIASGYLASIEPYLAPKQSGIEARDGWNGFRVLRILSLRDHANHKGSFSNSENFLSEYEHIETTALSSRECATNKCKTVSDAKVREAQMKEQAVQWVIQLFTSK